MEKERKLQIATFRFGVISDFVGGARLHRGEKERLLTEKSERIWEIPGCDQYSTFNGMGVARWDGDTLVVESIGFGEDTWLGWEGYFHSDSMKVTERFLRQGNMLFYNFTVDDPKVLMEPWTSITYVRTFNGTPARMGEAGECSERDINLLADPFLRG